MLSRIIWANLSMGRLIEPSIATRLGRIKGGDPGNAVNQARLAGYMAGPQEHGITQNPDWVLQGGATPLLSDIGYENAKNLCARSPTITAVFCYNDFVALGAIRAARELGRQVPEELSVVGFDDNVWAGDVDPPLTTFRFPREEMGRKAASLLLDRIERRQSRSAKGRAMSDEPCEAIMLKAELIIRKSSGSAPSSIRRKTSGDKSTPTLGE